MRIEGIQNPFSTSIMNNDSGKSISIWMNTEDVPPFEPLDCDHETDVCIIGAGIAGITTAYLLVNQGKSVTIIEDGPLAGGETARTTAHLASALDDSFEL